MTKSVEKGKFVKKILKKKKKNEKSPPKKQKQKMKKKKNKDKKKLTLISSKPKLVKKIFCRNKENVWHSPIC